MAAVVGSVSALWRFPVKSMQGEALREAEVTPGGLVGDRAYALVDVETGKVGSAKSVRHFPGLLEFRASFVASPQAGREAPAVRIDFPGGKTVTSDSEDVDRALSAHFRRAVRLARVAPDDFSIDHFHPDVQGAGLEDQRNTVTAQKLGAPLFNELGIKAVVPVGSFFDAFPLSVMTTSTLRQLNELQPQSRFDQRRFRMNIIVGTERQGFVENEWVGRGLGLGAGARISVELLDPRCVMTTLAQGDLPQDIEILRAIVHHNRLPVATLGSRPCAGVYAVVVTPGTVRAGDVVTLL